MIITIKVLSIIFLNVLLFVGLMSKNIDMNPNSSDFGKESPKNLLEQIIFILCIISMIIFLSFIYHKADI